MTLSELLQGCSNKSGTVTICHKLTKQDCNNIVIMIVTDFLDQACDKSDKISKDVTSCSKLVDNLGQAVRRPLVDSLYADLLQVVRFLRV